MVLSGKPIERGRTTNHREYFRVTRFSSSMAIYRLGLATAPKTPRKKLTRVKGPHDLALVFGGSGGSQMNNRGGLRVSTLRPALSALHNPHSGIDRNGQKVGLSPSATGNQRAHG